MERCFKKFDFKIQNEQRRNSETTQKHQQDLLVQGEQ